MLKSEGVKLTPKDILELKVAMSDVEYLERETRAVRSLESDSFIFYFLFYFYFFIFEMKWTMHLILLHLLLRF